MRKSHSKIDRILASGKMSTEPDWNGTLDNLMTLAVQAAKEYDFERAISYLNTLEDILDSKGFKDSEGHLRIDLHREKGQAYASQGKYDEAIDEYQKILRFCRDNTRLTVKSETFTQIGQLLAKQGDYDRALSYLQRAIGAYRRLDNKAGICRALRNLGVVYLELGEFEEAEINYNDAIDLAAEIGERILYSDLINNLGAIKNMKGDWRQALKLYRRSLEIYRTENQKRKQAYTENNLAITLSEQGFNDEAFEYFQKAYSTASAIQDASLKLIVDINLADLYLKRGEIKEARQHCDMAEQYLIEAELYNGQLVETKKIAGKIAYSENRYDLASVFYDDAIEISREIGVQYLEAEVLLERGLLNYAIDSHEDALNDLESSYHIFRSLKAEGKREHTEELINSIEKLYLKIFDEMAAEVDRKDRYTKGHSDRVAAFSLLLSKELGLATGMLKTIVAAALLHDVGKVKIDDTILKTKGRLDHDEFAEIKKHPELGVEFLRGKEFPWDIKPLILHHHEKLDGTGYPLGLKGEDIPLGARIICIADVFDALTSDRVYRKAFDTEKALQIMEDDSNMMFDPVILNCFMRMIRQGKADLVINSKTSKDEMYSIWAQCMLEDDGQETSEIPENTGRQFDQVNTTIP